MDWTLALQTWVPPALGLAAGLLGLLSPRTGRLGGLVFLAAQVGLIYAAGYATLSGLAFVLVLLGAFAAIRSRRPKAALGAGADGEGAEPRPVAAAATALFVAYLAYWAVEKYAVPLGLFGWLASVAPAAAPAAGWVQAIAIVGISYIGFKFIHFHVDAASGEFADADSVEFLNWLLFFPAIVAGPMQRFQDWQEQRAAGGPTLDAVVDGVRRILLGLCMKFVFADTIRGWSLAAMDSGALSVAGFWQLVGAALVYTTYLYLDFAGYSSIAIGMGRFWGITLPENFQHPFVARNLAEFWNRWHISLSQILRDYLYYPLSLAVKRREFFRPRPDAAAAIPPLLTFAVAGIWHGAGLSFLAYGLVHGIGLAYLAIRKRRRPSTAFGKWWQKSRTGHVLGALATYGYVSFSFVFFCLSTSNLALLLGRLGATR